MRKRTVQAALVLVAICVLLTACWDLEEPGDLGIVKAIGIDAGDVPETLKVTIAVSVATGGGQNGASQPQAMRVLTTQALTIFEAFTLLHSHVRNRMFFQHAQFVVFGEELARAGLGDVIGDLMGVSQLRGSINLLVAVGSAEEILHSRSGVGQPPALDVKDLLNNVRSAPIAVVATLDSSINTLSALGSELVLPILEQVPLRLEPTHFGEEQPQQEGLKEVIIARAALFDRDRWVAELDPYETMMLVLLRNDARSGSLTFENPDNPQGLIAVEMTSFRTKYDIKVQGEEIEVTIRPALGTKLLEARKEYDLRQLGVEPINQAMAQQVNAVASTLVDTLKKLGVDSLGIGQKIASQDPATWAKLEPLWREKYPQIRVNVLTRASVTQTGFITKFFNVKQPE